MSGHRNLVRCACGVLAMDRASLPEPCQRHGELAVVAYVPASRFQEAVEALERIVVACDNGSAPEDKLTFIRRVASAGVNL